MKITKVGEYGKGWIVVDTDEGRQKRSGGTVSWRCNNVGNLKFGEFTKKFGAVGRDFGGHSVFPTVEDGKRAKYALLFGDGSRYVDKTILAAMRIYAPADDPDADNDPDGYARFLGKRVGVPVSFVLRKMNDDQRSKFIDAISFFEGYKEGTITKMGSSASMGSHKKPGGLRTKLRLGTGKVMGPAYIQEFLAEKGSYHEELDGDLGKASLEAIVDYLRSQDVDATSWSKAQKIVGIEQAIYKKDGLEVGKIDGKVGPQTKYAREVWAAKQSRDEKAVAEITTFRDKPVVKVHWPLQSECRTYFGNVGENQTKLILPFPMVLAWDKSVVVKSYSCHEKVREPMERIWKRTLDEYGYEKIKELRLDLFGGCLNVRKMRGGSSWSQHAWGIAVDIDPDRNALNTPWKQAQMSKPAYEKFVQFWYDEGAISLGKEANFDAQHFQFSHLR